tara:strand:+ start:315 stop:536 length:222 start_codon:yes stop_codon:yes gene_type:complete
MNKTSIIILFLFSLEGFAYAGPGLGGGIIAVIVGFFLAIFLALWGILYYPLKRVIKKRKDKKLLSTEDINDFK